MMDPTALGSVKPPSVDTQVFPQPLPDVKQSDSTRFQDLVTGIGNMSSSQASVRDQPVLQRMDSVQSGNELGLVDSLVDKASSIDKSYQSILSQLHNRPSFNEYLETYRGGEGSNLRTYPSVSSSHNVGANFKETVEKMQIRNDAALDYQRDMTAWGMNFQMWTSGVELIGSIVSQVSKGFQTLFRASG